MNQEPTNHFSAYGGEQDVEGWARIDSDDNIWSDNFEGHFFGQRSLAEWRAASSREQQSALSNSPGLMDPAQRDYRLVGGAMAIDFGHDVLDLRGGGAQAPINAGAYISPAQDEVLGIRPVSITNTEALNWQYPFE